MFSLEEGNAEYGLSFIIGCKLNVAHFSVCIHFFFLLLQLNPLRNKSKRIQILVSVVFFRNVLRITLEQENYHVRCFLHLCAKNW